MGWFRFKYLWWATLAGLGMLSFFDVPLPRNWKAVMDWLTVAEAWACDNIAHPIIFALVIGLATGTVIIPEAWTIARRRLAGPRVHLTFDKNDYECMHPAPLADGTTGLCIRVLPECDTHITVRNCQGHLNGVYQRQSENNKWKKTRLGERLSLSWGNRGFAPITFPSGLRQYLDVFVVHKEHGIQPFVQVFPSRAQGMFNSKDFFRFDIFVTGDDGAVGRLSLQVRQTDNWEQPEIRVLAQNELEIENVAR